MAAADMALTYKGRRWITRGWVHGKWMRTQSNRKTRREAKVSLKLDTVDFEPKNYKQRLGFCW